MLGLAPDKKASDRTFEAEIIENVGFTQEK